MTVKCVLMFDMMFISKYSDRCLFPLQNIALDTYFFICCLSKCFISFDLTFPISKYSSQVDQVREKMSQFSISISYLVMIVKHV